ncbi:lethal(2)neighbour of Tid protein [Daktulosphaira vitifoliae]|uniref:lethal(2)neighbour of Tid protein n=1 Tax=Daktulosphaira vitifoliae TaxID=58002 RepID=UPI0021AA3E79|nr:lethal(2)neighbour of Tid protein [Daktulosphaira vitifoliae]
MWKICRKTVKAHYILEKIKLYLFDPSYTIYIKWVVLIIEFVLNLYIIQKVKYTEIDWKAYMQEVEGVVNNGTFDYNKLKGDTGPLVYPAGFVYTFTILYYLTEYGKNIRIAQYLYMLFYLINIYLVFKIHERSKKVPPFVMLLQCFSSYRIHSIYVLRLFNDPIAVILLYLSLYMFLKNKWTCGSIIYSLAVSIKMNILLYSPALLIAYITKFGTYGTIKHITYCALIQLILGLPFLLTNPINYIQGAFDLSRIFLYKWSVNWKFIPPNIFVSGYFHILLLMIHITVLLCFTSTWFKYLNSYAKMKQIEHDLKPQLKKKKISINMDISANLFLLPMFTANFIGIMFSRSLHYQFYVWYYHTLPFLLWSTPYGNKFRLIILGLIEICWNTYPATALSSALLHICHCMILYGLHRYRYRYGSIKKK